MKVKELKNFIKNNEDLDIKNKEVKVYNKEKNKTYYVNGFSIDDKIELLSINISEIVREPKNFKELKQEINNCKNNYDVDVSLEIGIKLIGASEFF